MMKPGERVRAVLNRQPADRIPRFEVWIDGLFSELGVSDPYAAYAELGQDGVLMPSQTPPESNSWKTGVDEWGRVWQDGFYRSGALDNPADLARFSPPLAYADRFFDPAHTARVRAAYPDHCLFFGTHIGPFMNAYMAMGLDQMSLRMLDDPPFIHALLQARTDWCLAVFQRAVALGAEVIVMGDDSAHHGGPMISPRMWREFVLPCHRRIVQALPVPVIWHSDGNITRLLPMAVEAGFAGVHGLEPWSVSLPEVRETYGDRLVLLGNVDVRLLCAPDPDAVLVDMQRSLQQGAPGGAYMFSTCNSIFPGMNPDAVRSYFQFQARLLEV